MSKERIYTIDELMAMGLDVDDLKELAGVKSEPPKSTRSIIEDTTKSALLGILQGATFGFGDEILQQTTGMTPEQIERIKQFDPSAFMLGEIAGSFAVPVPGIGILGKGISKVASTLSPVSKSALTVAKPAIEGAATGAVAGGLQSLGEAEIKDEKALEEGAETGGIIGALIPASGKLASKVVDTAKKMIVPRSVVREKLGDIFDLARQSAKEGIDIEDKSYIQKQTEETFDATKKFIESLIEATNKKRRSLYETVETIANEKNVKVPLDKVKDILADVDEFVDSKFTKEITKHTIGKQDISYKDAKNLEEIINSYILSDRTDNATKRAALQMKQALKDARIESLPPEGKEALKIADDYYQRVAGVDPNTGEALGDFYAALGKGMLDLSTFDQGKKSEEIVRMTKKLMEGGSEAKYRPADVYTTHLKKFEDFIKESGSTPEETAKLLEDWKALQDQMTKRGILESVFTDSTQLYNPSLANIRPETALTRLTYGAAAGVGKAVGGVERVFDPAVKHVAKPLYDIIAGNPEKVRQKIEEYEQKGHKNLADYLRYIANQIQLQRAETPKLSKSAAQQYISSQNPGLRDVKKDLEEEE
ncbi:MAG: hypothetical protein RML94_01765 [Bacteroidia bacterium]|nr:hypothetical protein [Bacteroidia bacterium]